MTKTEIINQLEKARRQLKVAKEQDEIDFVEEKIRKLEQQLAEVEKKEKTEETKAKKKSKPKEKKQYKFKDPIMEKEPATFEECKDLLAQARKRMKSSREWREKRERAGKPPEKTVTEVIETAAEQVEIKVDQLDEKKN